ncbi:MAG: 3-oxo-tetronate kinase [Pseudomonadota bacterium]
MSLLVGAIADDFTGGTDLANTLVKSGMRTVQTIGVPDEHFDASGFDAVVIALKIRTIAPQDAISQARGALAWFTRREAAQILWKYCSTFDSTDTGNIGPVADMLCDALDVPLTIVCPAFPTTGRTLYKGHLFVGDALLSASGMEHHPLTPMRDANLVSVLSRQTPHDVGLVELSCVQRGPDAVRHRIETLQANGARYAVADAVNDDDLRTLGTALSSARLITGGSGIAIGLAENFRRAGTLGAAQSPELPEVTGGAAILSGSCSQATRRQVEHFSSAKPTYRFNMQDCARPETTPRALADAALAWVSEQDGETPILISASAAPDQVAQLQDARGIEAAGALIEDALALTAKALVVAGRHTIIVAGGETSGAVTRALDVNALRIGPEIDPGVPWTIAMRGPHSAPLALALKSGNFGGDDFFSKALGMIQPRNPS